MKELKFFESAFFPPQFEELICMVFKAVGFLLCVWRFCFGWFCLVSFAGWGKGVECFLDLGNSRKTIQFSWPIS